MPFSEFNLTHRSTLPSWFSLWGLLRSWWWIPFSLNHVTIISLWQPDTRFLAFFYSQMSIFFGVDTEHLLTKDDHSSWLKWKAQMSDPFQAESVNRFSTSNVRLLPRFDDDLQSQLLPNLILVLQYKCLIEKNNNNFQSYSKLYNG